MASFILRTLLGLLEVGGVDSGGEIADTLLEANLQGALLVEVLHGGEEGHIGHSVSHGDLVTLGGGGVVPAPHVHCDAVMGLLPNVAGGRNPGPRVGHLHATSLAGGALGLVLRQVIHPPDGVLIGPVADGVVL